MTKEQRRKYYLENWSKLQESKRRYRANPINRENELAAKRKYHALNKDKERAYRARPETIKKIRKGAKRRYALKHAEILEQCRAYYHENRKEIAQRRTLSKYGLTKEQLELQLKKQKWKCPICKRSLIERKPHIDHCHKVGHIRGILCRSCNVGLGCFEDSIVFLKGALNYLSTEVLFSFSQ